MFIDVVVVGAADRMIVPLVPPHLARIVFALPLFVYFQYVKRLTHPFAPMAFGGIVIVAMVCAVASPAALALLRVTAVPDENVSLLLGGKNSGIFYHSTA
jgi:hypothetical protein